MPARDQLINSQGQPAYGLFPEGVREINYLDYDLRSVMDRKRSSLAKKLGFNQFEFVSFLSKELIVGLAVVDLKLVSNAFLYLYEPETGKFEEFSFLQPLGMGTQIEPRPNDGSASFIKGGNRFLIHASTTPGVRRVQVSLARGVEIDATIDESTAYDPLLICTRAGYQGWVFTQKSAARICNGSIRWHEREFDLQSIGALAAVDWTGGYMRRETFWNWGSLSCRLRDGRRLGFNLAAGVNETGHSENALWLDDKLIKIDMVDFMFDRYHPTHSWAMRSSDGIIDLHFEPSGRRQDKTNALFIASNFSQYFGRYHGEIRLPDETITLEGEWGLSEDHFARW
ncbi:DUF2804 domain-containing protein [Thalassolituus marinus]|uniref:DUF2804 domain-containing protein n=1 Tax=Thalassolituus marinus TaxID=671053 RepID=A0ABS7ZQG5_9GAMM|nr:DUF2804 domain-containing protein [Thalassolituus marinus]MCA6063967.1 DUF2804 domain-containing protein [Thalassolituus marinus]